MSIQRSTATNERGHGSLTLVDCQGPRDTIADRSVAERRSIGSFAGSKVAGKTRKVPRVTVSQQHYGLRKIKACLKYNTNRCWDPEESAALRTFRREKAFSGETWLCWATNWQGTRRRVWGVSCVNIVTLAGINGRDSNTRESDYQSLIKLGTFWRYDAARSEFYWSRIKSACRNYLMGYLMMQRSPDEQNIHVMIVIKMAQYLK